MPIVEIIPAHCIPLVGGLLSSDKDTVSSQSMSDTTPQFLLQVNSKPLMLPNSGQALPRVNRRVKITQVSYPRRKVDAATAGDPQVPALNLRGKWLEEIGFGIGKAVKIEIKNRQLVITLEP